MMNLKQIAEEAHKIAKLKEAKGPMVFNYGRGSHKDDVQAQAMIHSYMKKLRDELNKMGYKTYLSQEQSSNMGTRYFIDVE